MGLRKGDFMDRYIAITKRVPKPDRHRDKDSLWTEIWPSQVHITERDLNPNRHGDKDSLWTEIWPSQVHITERDFKPVDIGIWTIYRLRSGHLKFISLKGT